MAFTYGTVTNCKSKNGETRTEYQCRLGYQVNSQSIENNTSNITLQLEVRSINSGYYTFGANQTTTIDGTQLSAQSFDMRDTNVWQIFGTHTFDVSHNADGTYSTDKSGSFTTTATSSNYSLKRGSASVTVSLPTIARASSFSLSASSYVLGDTVSVTISRASNSFTHKVYYVIGNSGEQVLAWEATTSASDLLANSLANYIPTTSGTATMYVDTYNGNTYIGTTSQTFTINIPDSNTFKPSTPSITTSDTQGRLSIFGAYVQGKSTLRIQSSSSGVYGSSIQGYTVQIMSGNTILQTLYGSDVSLGNISYTGTITINVIATDTRGRTKSNSTSVSVIAYNNPQATVFTANRDNSTPSNVSVVINASVTALNNNNTQSFVLKYKKTSVSSWTSVDLTSSASNYTLNITHPLTNIDDNSTYDLRLEVSDYFTTSSYDILLGTSFELMNWKSDGTAMAVGKVSEESYAFECALKAIFYDKILSVEESTGVSGRSNIRIIGNAQYNYLPNGSTDTETCCKALIKWICNTYPNDVATMYIFTYEPNARGMCFVHIYDNSETDSNGFPNHATGFYLSYGGTLVTFGTSYFSWYFASRNIGNIAVKDTDNNFSASQSFSSDAWVGGRLYNGSSHGLTLYNQSRITSDPVNSFQSSLFGSDNDYDRLKVSRVGSSNVGNGMYAYSSIIAATTGDTHMYITGRYDSAEAWMGAGNNNQLNWAKQIEFAPETGTSGIWTYIKYNNGFAICYGVYETTISIDNSWGGNGFTSGGITLPDFPFTFTSTPTVTTSTVNTPTSDGYMAVVGNAGAANSYPTTTYPGKVTLFRGTSLTSKKFAISINAMGFWK